jgi:hypothetical protein
MELEISENPVCSTSSNENERSSVVERADALVIKLARFYSVMGNAPDEPGALALIAQIMVQRATDEQINSALTRCARECRYPVRLSDILQRIPGQEIPELEAETRKAWDVVVQFVDKWVQSDVEGNYKIDQGIRSTKPPQLDQRILNTVRRTGGWKAYKCMTADDFPFLQKRFFEEYAASTAVECIDSSKMLTAPGKEQVKQLTTAKTMETPKAKPPAQIPTFRKANSRSPLTETEIRGRRELLKQQTAKCVAQRNVDHA